MRFFTRAWVGGGLTEREVDEAIEAYESHLASLSPSLPPSILELARGINLHDGRIRRVSIDFEKCEVFLGLICGDRQQGYFKLDLLYSGVVFDRTDFVTLEALAIGSGSEIVRDEVDRAEGGGYIHRMIFWPEGEVVITFLDLAFSRTNLLDRELN